MADVTPSEEPAQLVADVLVAAPAPPTKACRPNTRGLLRGKIWLAPGWEATPDDLIDLMEGGGG
jgi:hypothetical protein